MKVTGLDLSLRATGIATDLGITVIKPATKAGMGRLAILRAKVHEYVIDADLVVIEGYSYGSGRASGTTHAHALGELGGVIRLLCFDEGIRYVDVPPATLKKFATGKGQAPKEAMLASAIRRLGYDGDDHNEVDALWLREMGLAAYALTDRDHPNSHTVALDKVAWPRPDTTTHPVPILPEEADVATATDV